jgi:hypothetical protein
MAKSYEEDEDYYDRQADREDFRRYGKSRHKDSGSSEGHRKHRRGDVQDFMDEIDRQQEEVVETENAPRHYSPNPHDPSPIRYGTPNPSPAFVPQHHEHRFGPNTIEFKGVKIDFDGVKDILPIESRHNGFQTYGIKFLFLGEKGFYKIVWYETDKTGRDVDVASAMAKMKGIGKAK